MEKMSWPPKGSMGPIFGEYLFIRFFSRSGEECGDNRYWPLPKFQELLMQICYNVVPIAELIKERKQPWFNFLTASMFTNSNGLPCNLIFIENESVTLFLDTFLEITTQPKTWSSQCFTRWGVRSTQMTPLAIQAKNYFTFGHSTPST